MLRAPHRLTSRIRSFDWQPPIHWREQSEIRKLNLCKYYFVHRKTGHCKYMSRNTIAFWAMNLTQTSNSNPEIQVKWWTLCCLFSIYIWPWIWGCWSSAKFLFHVLFSPRTDPRVLFKREVTTLRWFLRNKSYRWIFLKLSLNVLYQALLRKMQ